LCRDEKIISGPDLGMENYEESAMALGKFICGAGCLATGICLSLWAGIDGIAQAVQVQTAQQPVAQSVSIAKPVGTIKSISGNTITLTTDAGTDVTVLVQDATKLLRIAPGQTDLKDATPLELPDVQVGDRILVRGKLAEDGKSVLAASVIAMKKEDISQKQSREREEWQKHAWEVWLLASIRPQIPSLFRCPQSAKRKT